MRRLLAFVLPLCVLAACGTKEGPPPAATSGTTKTSTPNTPKMPDAPKEVPRALKERADKRWLDRETMGNELDTHFDEFSVAQRAADRAKMDELGPPLQKLYNQILEEWNVIAYYPHNNLDDDAQIEACERYLRNWSTQVSTWTKKGKGLKEFSTVGD